MPKYPTTANSAPFQPQQTSPFLNAELVRQLNLAADTFSQTSSLSHRVQNALTRFHNSPIDFEVRQIKHNAITAGIWNFYPTPKTVIDRMLELADLKPYHLVLEPSTGSGDLAKLRSRLTVWKYRDGQPKMSIKAIFPKLKLL